MSLTDDLRSFVIPPRAHGTVTYTASAATESGYDLRLRCTCGRSYYVDVTPDAEDFRAPGGEELMRKEGRRSKLYAALGFCQLSESPAFPEIQEVLPIRLDAHRDEMIMFEGLP